MDKYILQHGQIQLSKWTIKFYDLDKYIQHLKTSINAFQKLEKSLKEMASEKQTKESFHKNALNEKRK